MSQQPALKAAIFLSAGILIGYHVTIRPEIIMPAVLFILPVAGLLIRLHRWKPIGHLLLVVLILCTGYLRFHDHLRYPDNHISLLRCYEEPVTVQGVMTKDPIVKEDYEKWTIEATSVLFRDSIYETQGKILATLYVHPQLPIKYGTEIKLSGILREPKGKRNPGGFDYKAYLKRQNIHALLRVNTSDSIDIVRLKQGNRFKRTLIYPVRRSLISWTKMHFKPIHQGFIQALLLGERSDLDPDQKNAFIRSGLVHVLAVSGMHVGFIVIALSSSLGFLRIPRTMRTIFIILGLIFYMYLTESKPPVIRATIMVIVYLIGVLWERNSNPLNAIGIAAIIILTINPLMLFDVGFQLSFIAILSILYLFPYLYQIKFIQKIKLTHSKRKLLTGSLMLLLVSIAAQLGTLPITSWYFNRIPLLSIGLNVIAIPIIGIIVGLTLILFLFHPVSIWIAQTFGLAGTFFLELLIKSIDKIAALPFASISVPTPSIYLIFSYYTLLIIVLKWRHRSVRNFLIILGLFFLNIWIWHINWTNPSNKMRWVQFDVGQGDAAILHLPHDKHILIDAGVKQFTFDSGEKIIAPYLRKKGIRQLDAILISHPHGDHIGGIPYLLENFKVDALYSSGTPFETGTMNTIDSLIEAKNITCHHMTAPDTLYNKPWLQSIFLSPDKSIITEPMNRSHDINNQSLVLQVRYGESKWLFMGDAEKPVERHLLSKPHSLQSNAIKIAHHGSETSTISSFLNAVDPDFAVISVAGKNRHGHPSENVIQRLQENNIKILRTDEQGAVILQTEGIHTHLIRWK